MERNIFGEPTNEQNESVEQNEPVGQNEPFGQPMNEQNGESTFGQPMNEDAVEPQASASDEPQIASDASESGWVMSPSPTNEQPSEPQPAAEPTEPQASVSNEPQQAEAASRPERIYAEVAQDTANTQRYGYGQQYNYGQQYGQQNTQYQPQPMFGSNAYYSQPQNFYGQYPNYGYQPPQPEKPKKKKRKWLRRLVAALVILAIVGGAAGAFVAFFDVEFTDNGFTVIQRGFWEKDDTEVMRGDGGDSIYAPPSNEPNGVVTAEPAGENGPEMQIDESPVTTVDYIDSDEPLTTQEIAAKCTDWTVGVIATTYYSNNYYYGYGGAASVSGTGIIMSQDGYIITNHHVVEGATDLTVVMMDSTEYPAQLIGSDERSDLAVLKIDAVGLSAAEFGDSDALMVGDPVVAIGNPLGLELMGTVTNGIVSAINRDVAVEERTMTLIQTNAAINSGNSGGPLINQYGQVIGINTLKMQDYSTTIEGLGFAIPTNTAKVIIDELIEKGYVSGYPAIGIRYSNVSESMARYYSIPVGVLVGYVYPEANAYAAGLQVNDVIVEAQGVEVTDGATLIGMLEDYVAGDTFEIVVYHYDSRLYETITFELNDENDFADGGTLIAPQ